MREFILIFLCCILAEVDTTDDHPYYAANGIVCNKCPPGTKVDTDCTENHSNSTCIPCPDHEYMDKWNDKKHCNACKSGCPVNGKEVQTCTKTTNRECLCEDGFHRYPVDHIDPHWVCKAHSSCEPGYGEKHYGNHSHDTACEKCVEGQQFVNMADDRHPKCQPCSVCVNDTYPLSNCTLTDDTVCSDSATDAHTTDTPRQQEQDSGGLGGGAIAGIVIGIIMVGIIFFAIWYHRRQHRKKDDKNGTRTEGGSLATASNTRQPTETEMTSPGENQTDNTGASEPLLRSNQNWTEQFIERRVFPYISKHLGTEWPHFILQLPGWPEDQSVSTIIEHKDEEESTVARKTLGCLVEWMRIAHQSVCKESIVSALNSVERTDIIEHLEQLASDEPPPTQPNGSNSAV